MRRLLVVVLAGALLATGAACGFRTEVCGTIPIGSCAPPPGSTQDTWPQGREFAAPAYVEQLSGVVHPFVSGTALRVTFGEPGNLQAYAGCNHLSVRGTLNGFRIMTDSVASTKIGCAAELQAQDEWLADFFEADPEWGYSGDQLTLHTFSAEILMDEA